LSPGSQSADVRIRQQILQIAPVDVPVFICGRAASERSCGSLIHLRSKRRKAVRESELRGAAGRTPESELIRFEQGALYRRVRSKRGSLKWQQGQIFLDEIAGI